MVFNTATVGGAVTPAVISTFITHYLNRKPLAQKPTAHISYDEGLHLIRKFLIYASHHTVEDVQRFTSQWVPHPTWVKVDEVKIPQEYIVKSAEAIQQQLGNNGIEKVGGKTWWQWRRPGSQLEAEWIEMKTDYAERKRTNDQGKRVMLYVHGGAYFFGSVDEHRYQMQRHARKLKARVFAPRYRLAPQFPFPCGLQDCLAAYLYLLSVQDPSTIILAGDSAGGGMVLSILVTLRDRGIPLPAGAVLISPWVDLTHSFPSVAADNPMDYIPPYGFHQRPSPSWPPPNSDDMLAMDENAGKGPTHQEHVSQQLEQDAVQGFHVDKHPEPGTANNTAATGTGTNDGSGLVANTVPGPDHNLSMMIDGKLVEIKDQIQMYATNQLISHPLVSPALQPSLGGLPPLLILVGGGEMLRDEQIYVAHKAAHPEKYPPGDAFLNENLQDQNKHHVNKWRPTHVQLQVWDDLCHVAPTLSFTRPAKYMYRSIAQFGAWALARAQDTEIDIMDDDISVISQSDDSREGSMKNGKDQTIFQKETVQQVGKAGDPLPPFKHHMIRQRVDRHGNIYELAHESSLPACNMDNNVIGVIKEGPVRKWIAKKKEWDTKYATAKRNVQKMRLSEMAAGYEPFPGEVPPPSALAGRRRASMEKEQRRKMSMGLSVWALWGSNHDKTTMNREISAENKERDGGKTVTDETKGANARPLNDKEIDLTKLHPGGQWTKRGSRRRQNRRQTVTDLNQTGSPYNSTDALTNDHTTTHTQGNASAGPTPTIIAPTIVESVIANAPAEEFDLKRPKAAGIAFPFTIKNKAASASMTTLTSAAEIPAAENVITTDALEDGVGRSKSSTLGLPFNLKQHGASASMTTLTSTVGVAPAEDIRTEEALSSGVEPNIVQNGEVFTSTTSTTKAAHTRPPLETFITAPEIHAE